MRCTVAHRKALRSFKSEAVNFDHGKYFDCPDDPVLKVIRIDTRKLKAMFALASCSVFVSPIGIAFSQLALDPESWKLLNFYAVVLGCALYTSAFTFIFAYVTGLSFFVVLPLLKISTRKFETATETLDLATLHVSNASMRNPRTLYFL